MNTPDILRIVKEDVLRILGEERGNSVSLTSLKSEIKVSSAFLKQSIEELEKEGLIQSKKELIVLTKRGQENASDIVEKHVSIENYFKEVRSEDEAHKAAHVLEHYVSQEVIDNIKKLSTFRKEGIPLTEFDLNDEGIITNIAFFDFTLFERIISMGIFPGEKVRVTNVIPGSVVVRIGNKKFALSGEIAEGIEVLANGKT
jgi:Mn-dependent DtxR family transcriptional regulator